MKTAKQQNLQEFLVSHLKEALQDYMVDPTSGWYKAKKPHYKKYRNSKMHPDEIEKQKDKDKIQVAMGKKTGTFDFGDPGYEIPKNVRVFLNTTLQTLPKTETSTKILQGIPVTKRDAMELSRSLIALPHFPYSQPRKLMSLLILLSIENAKE